MGESQSVAVVEHASADRSTNTTAVIVALPRAMDPIRLVGNEDKHATLLFFGETNTLPSEARFVLEDTAKRICKIFGSFSESIENVTRLGSDDPPALVALTSGRQLGVIRKSMLINPKVVEYLTNTNQFPSYTPHVTLDYPDYAGEAELRDLMQSLYRIQFDRLALWWGNEQIEFSLDSFDGESTDVKMSDGAGIIQRILEHSGVKGMRWGVRRTPAQLAAGKASSDKSIREKLGLRPKAAKPASSGSSSSGTSHHIPDHELQALVNRMRLEQEFRKLSSEAAPHKKADGFIKSLIKENGKRQVQRVAKSALDLAIEQALAKEKNSDFSKELSKALASSRKKK